MPPCARSRLARDDAPWAAASCTPAQSSKKTRVTSDSDATRTQRRRSRVTGEGVGRGQSDSQGLSAGLVVMSSGSTAVGCPSTGKPYVVMSRQDENGPVQLADEARASRGLEPRADRCREAMGSGLEGRRAAARTRATRGTAASRPAMCDRPAVRRGGLHQAPAGSSADIGAGRAAALVHAGGIAPCLS